MTAPYILFSYMIAFLYNLNKKHDHTRRAVLTPPASRIAIIASFSEFGMSVSLRAYVSLAISFSFAMYFSAIIATLAFGNDSM